MIILIKSAKYAYTKVQQATQLVGRPMVGADTGAGFHHSPLKDAMVDIKGVQVRLLRPQHPVSR